MTREDNDRHRTKNISSVFLPLPFIPAGGLRSVGPTQLILGWVVQRGMSIAYCQLPRTPAIVCLKLLIFITFSKPNGTFYPYLIFVISFTQTGFSETKFYTQKTTKGTKKTKNVSEKVKYMHFFHSIWKNLHLTEKFYTDMSVVSVTNMRYASIFFMIKLYYHFLDQ